MPGAIGGPTSVDGESVAVDEAAVGGVGEEEDGTGDIVGGGEAGHRNTAKDVVIGIGGGGLIKVVHLGLDPAGTDGVDANVAGAPLDGERTGEADEAMLGGVVGGAVGDAGEPGDRGDVDDASLPLLKHEGAEALGKEEGGDQVDLEHAAEGGGFDAFGGCDEADAGVVDEDIGAAPALTNDLDTARNEGFVGDIAEELFAVGGGNDMGTRLAIDESESVAGFGEEFRGAAADTLRGSGDDGDGHGLLSHPQNLHLAMRSGMRHTLLSRI